MRILLTKRLLFIFTLGVLFGFQLYASQPEYSTAGYYTLSNTGRNVYSMNVAWRFHKGELVDDPSKVTYKDSLWSVVSLPHGIEYLPVDASGSINYQGVVWYRKHFIPNNDWKEKKVFLHFEAIMGKSEIWINGISLTKHFGGYLPVSVDISNFIKWDGDNVISVKADNSNDPTYSPGKKEENLDFTYFGGIYRDCWLVVHNKVHITDPNFENETAGGGLFVAFDKVGSELAEVLLKTHIRNSDNSRFDGTINYELFQADGKKVKSLSKEVKIRRNEAISVADKMDVSSPHLWSPESPYLYSLNVTIRNKKGEVIDGYREKIGIRSIEFKGKDGFWLNGKPYNIPLLGGNRHQDFAVVGNATSNSANWRDAVKLRKAGFNIIRMAHYPSDPSFMDACDALGLFVIVPTPGWQFYNDDPAFVARLESDIRNMVRRDRNHPCVIFWEPILNETGLWGDSKTTYNEEAQGRSADLVKQEYPYKYCYSAGGPEKYFTVLYGGVPKPDKVYFTREYGDGGNVNNWAGQNAQNRASLAYGEAALLVQAESYAKSTKGVISSFNRSRQQMGGAMWCSFDAQRGYHPDPFFGGIMDAFRRPKYAYYLFMSHRNPEIQKQNIGSGPMVFTAHSLTPFSGKDVRVFSNCDEVHLTVFGGGEKYVQKKDVDSAEFVSPVFTFENVVDYDQVINLSRSGKVKDVYLKAEGLIDGKVVTEHKVSLANAATRIELSLDNEGMDLLANGSDFTTVVASIVDENGNVKRLNKSYVKFTIEGEGRILGGEDIFVNPRPVVWGDAPVLVQSTTKSGTIKVKAEVCFKGNRTPLAGELVFKSYEDETPAVYSASELAFIDSNEPGQSASDLDEVKRKSNVIDDDLKKVHEQQERFMQE